MTAKNLDNEVSFLNACNKTMFSHFKKVLIFMVFEQVIFGSANHILIGNCSV